MKKPGKSSPNPPGWIGKWLDRFVHRNLSEGIRGDLLEIFEEECERLGGRKARRRYVWRALGFFRATFRKKETHNQHTTAMWKNHFITSVRSLRRHNLYFLINTFGLTIALTCAIFAAIFSYDELSFDSQHSKADQIYRLYKNYVNPEGGTSFFTSETSGLMGPTMVEEYPELENFVRLRPWWDDVVVSYGERNFAIENFVFADSSFFEFFDFRLVAGNPETALREPSSIVLTSSLAAKLFGTENPMGRIVTGIHDQDFLVTGIVEDAPRTSHIQFDALASWTTTVPNSGPLNYSFMNNWIGQSLYTYLMVTPATDISAVEKKLPGMIGKYLPERADQYFLKLQPFPDVYLSSHDILGSQDFKMGSRLFLKIFSFTGLLVLLIAAFNYINISLAKISNNTKEVGVRKIIGSGKGPIIERFITETFIQVAFALVVSILLVAVLLPGFNEVSGKDIPVTLLTDVRIISGLIGFTILTTLLIGFYPALFITSRPAASMLRGSVKGVRIGLVRKFLLVIQYTVSIALIVGTIIIYNQTDFLKSQTENIAGDQVIVMNINNEVGEKREAFVNAVKSHPNVVAVANCQASIGSGTFGTTLFPEGSTSIFNSSILRIDHAFFETYDIELLEGHLFRPGIRSDSNGLVVNRTFIQKMGWDSAVGKKVKFDEADSVSYPIIGVVEDFHLESPAQYKVEPAVMYLTDRNRNNVSVRIGNGDIKATLAFLENTWGEFAQKTPFDFYFVDDWYAQQFAAETQMLNSSMIFAAISILLCGLGLYGITSLMLEQKMKEISIRKVLGAGTSALVWMVNKQFLTLIALGFLMATPTVLFLAGLWLDAFPYQIDIAATPFIVAGCLTLVISGLTVSLLTIKTSMVNPSSVLKME